MTAKEASVGAAVTAGPITFDEFLDGGYEHAELLGGEVRPKPVNSVLHMDAETWIVDALRRFYASRLVRWELSLRIGEDGLIPDVAVLPSEAPATSRGVAAEPPLSAVRGGALRISEAGGNVCKMSAVRELRRFVLPGNRPGHETGLGDVRRR